MGSAFEAEPRVQTTVMTVLDHFAAVELGSATASFNDAVAASFCCGQDWLCEDEPDAHTRQLQFALGLEHPYNLSDVESAAHDKIATARDKIHEQIKQQWLDSASLQTNEPLDLPLPDGAVTKAEVLEALKRAQMLRDPERGLVEALRDNQDPYRRRQRQVELDKGVHAQVAGQRAKTDAVNLDQFRLNPLNDVLEFERRLVVGLLYVPVIPKVACSLTESTITWRRYLFLTAHETMMNPHRSPDQTLRILERMGWWPTLARDCADWCLECVVCVQYRGTAMRPPTKSTAAGDAMSALLPWQDVIIDVTGPFTRAEGGERYVLSYLCTKLRVPKLAVLAQAPARILLSVATGL